MSLTRRQREILEFLRHFLRERGYAPSLLEIGQAFSLSSSATIHKHLSALEARGAIRRSRGRRRFLELTEGPPSAGVVELPLLGTIRAVPIRGGIRVPRSVARRDGLFVFGAGISARAHSLRGIPSVCGRRCPALVASGLGPGRPDTLLRRSLVAALRCRTLPGCYG